MARKSKSNRSRRDNLKIQTIANRRLPATRPIWPTIKNLAIIDDGRNYYPEHNRPARDIRGSRHRLTLKSQLIKSPSRYKTITPLSLGNDRISFHAPEKLLVCIRRKRREEVLHAINKTGRRGQKSPKFNRFSEIGCK